MSSSKQKPEATSGASSARPSLLSKIQLPENAGRVALELLTWIAALGLLFLFDEDDTLSRLTSGLFVAVIYFLLVAITGNLRTSIAGTTLLIALILGTSWAKISYLGVALVLDDLFYLTGHSLWSTITQYPSLMWMGAAGALALLFAIATMAVRNRFRLSLVLRVLALLLAINLSTRLPELSTTAYMRDPTTVRPCCAISSFANSVVNRVTHGAGKVSFANAGPEGLADFKTAAMPVPATVPEKPDIFMVLDESAFDPRDLGLPAQTGLNEYFSPAKGLSGALNVMVHGGGTWVTEFSAMTGLDTRSFGDKSYFLPVLMAGRVKHSLMTHLKSLGYETIVVYPVKGAFMNAENNYRALGADKFIGWSAEQHPGSVWMTQDRQLYEGALEQAAEVKRASGKPVFVAVITIHNHGPHSESAAADQRDEQVHAWLAQNAPGDEMAPYREFYRRLRRNVEDYGWFKQEYARRFPQSPLVIGHYGDHQPKFTKQLAGSAAVQDTKLAYRTRFAIEAINYKLAPVPSWGNGSLDVPYLPGVLLSATGLRQDALWKARLELMQRCKGSYFKCNDPLKGRIHRTLIDEGLLDVDQVLPAGLTKVSLAPPANPATKAQ